MSSFPLAVMVVCGAVLLATGAAATDSAASLTISGTVVSAEIPVADFAGTPTSGSAPLTVQFTDLSTGRPTEWEWDFESDGTIDAGVAEPTHIYTAPGVYTVSLTVRNAEGSDTEVKPGYIAVQEPDPGARIETLKEYIRELPIPPLTKVLLILPLERALNQLEKGHERPVVNQMELFIRLVDLMERFRVITHMQAAYMTGEAEEIIDLILF